MPIAKYTSAKGLYEYEDGSSGFFIEDAPLIQEQQELTLTHAVYTVTCVADQDKDNSELAAANGDFTKTGELIGDYFEIYDADGNQYYVWYQDGTGTGTDPAPGGTGIQVTLSDDGADNAATVAEKTANAIDVHAAFFSEHTGAVLKIQPIQPGQVPHSIYTGYNLPSSNDAANSAGSVTEFAVALVNADKPKSSYSVNDHGVTIFTLGTDPTHAAGGTGSNPTVVALADGSYVGQKKILNLAAAGDQSQLMEITGKFIDSNGSTSRTKVTLAAANDSMHVIWTGARWVNILETGSANMA